MEKVTNWFNLTMVGILFTFSILVTSGMAQSPAYREAVRELEGIAQARGINCKWEGTAPFCSGYCAPGWTRIVATVYGNGATCISGEKVYCCETTTLDEQSKKEFL